MNKIWVIDEQDTYRKGVKNLLEIRIQECSVDTFSFINKNVLDDLVDLPDLVIVDPSSTNSEIISVIDSLIKNEINVALLSMESDKERILQLLSKNISGYLKKSMFTKDLVSCIKSILAGNRYIHPSIGNVLLDEFHRTSCDFTEIEESMGT